jgi:hypothetical protein
MRWDAEQGLQHRPLLQKETLIRTIGNTKYESSLLSAKDFMEKPLAILIGNYPYSSVEFVRSNNNPSKYLVISDRCKSTHNSTSGQSHFYYW